MPLIRAVTPRRNLYLKNVTFFTNGYALAYQESPGGEP